MENGLAFPIKVKELPCDWAVPLLDIYPRELKTYPHKNLHVSVHSICNSPKVEQPKCLPANEWEMKYGVPIEWDIIWQWKGIKYWNNMLQHDEH